MITDQQQAAAGPELGAASGSLPTPRTDAAKYEHTWGNTAQGEGWGAAVVPVRISEQLEIELASARELINDFVAFEAELLTLLNVRPRENDYDEDDQTRIVEAVKAIKESALALTRRINAEGGHGLPVHELAEKLHALFSEHLY